ncbi:MAG: hypothetical protein DHS20C14_04460 [Phycisphaeraceae bacterium]|nr:MAG: hypothetical protein DHS20C14_04460 [Phycisphaeraceae bacterium]
MKTSTTCGPLAVLAGIAFASSANAGVISQADLAEVSNQVIDVDGVSTTVSSTPKRLQRKTVNGVTGMGIKGGNVNGEIDKYESMNFSFDAPVVVDGLTIAFLYDDGQFGDQPAEIARVVVDGDAYTLSVTGPTTAVWAGLGLVENISIATEAGGGAWRVSGDDIFGGAISSLTLESGNPGRKAKYADFSFVSLSTAVPAPGTAAMLGLGGLVAVRRRRSA